MKALKEVLKAVGFFLMGYGVAKVGADIRERNRQIANEVYGDFMIQNPDLMNEGNSKTETGRKRAEAFKKAGLKREEPAPQKEKPMSVSEFLNSELNKDTESKESKEN